MGFPIVCEALLPLTSQEIKRAADILKAHAGRNVPLHFKAITLEEPHKQEVILYLEGRSNGRVGCKIERLAYVNYYVRNTNAFYEATVSLSHGQVTKLARLGPEVHGALDVAEMKEIADLARSNSEVKSAIAELQLPAHAEIVIEPWMYGSDGVADANRQYQCFMFMRDPNNPGEPDSNHYAYPLPISPVMDAVTKKIVRVDKIPMGLETKRDKTQPYEIYPPNEYIPEAQESLRKDLKPLRVVQPEGVSFRITPLGETGQFVEWQKWAFQVGFNQREGMVLYNVTYENRSVMYRLALSEMNVPYGDPRAPFHRKAAFDLGDAGAGATANNLKLGCDCLGSIQYLNGVISNDEGRATVMPNCICVHEQDNGIGWKHSNWRTDRAVVVRNRELVLQSILTLANYEYILAFIFNQAGEICYEVRATGILSTQPIEEGINSPYGTVVHPGVLAPYHQHVFSLRIDPAIDGARNRVVYEEAYAMPRDNEVNPHGVGYVVREKAIDVAGGYDLDYTVNRTFKVVNNSVRNPINHKAVGYKIQVPPFQTMLADRDSFHFKRAEFADHHIYVTKYKPEERFAGGKHTNQSRGGDGVRTWSKRKDTVKDTDIVIWVQFGMNHIPRIEDFPVMPVEIIKVNLKPNNFFTKNPSMDVPPSDQRSNQSVLVNSSSGSEGEMVSCHL